MSHTHSSSQIDQMDIDEAMNTLNVRMHRATDIIDELVAAGKINASARLIRQEICCYARKLIEQRWVQK